MKARPFLAVVLAVALLLFTLGGGGWWVVLRRSPLRLQEHSLQLPLAARFVPRNAPFSLHLLVGPDQLGAYARAVAPPRRRAEAADAVARLRDGAFASAGLDYPSELAPWLGDETSLALLAPDGPGGDTGWLLALRSRDSGGARRFLQRFWQTRSLAGTDLQISSYRGMGLISGRGALLGQPSRPLATALIDDRLVLIASGRGVLEQALDVSQIDELNQGGDLALEEACRRLDHGVALLTARPEAFADWLGLPAPFAAGARDLVAALAPSERALDLQGLFGLADALPPLRLEGGQALLAGLRGSTEAVALVENPAALLGLGDPTASAEEASGPWSRLLGSALQRVLAELNGPLPALVVAADSGPLLAARRSEGWLLATGADQPAPEALQLPLERDGYVAAPLRSGAQELTVWTRLEAGSGRADPDQLRASVAGARLVRDGVAWWGEGLAALADQREGRRPPQERLGQLEALRTPTAPLQGAMAAESARLVLARWQPWQRLGGLGGPLGPAVQGLAFSVQAAGPVAEGSDEGSTATGLDLRVRLELG